MNNQVRKLNITEMLSKVILENPDQQVMEVIRAVLRRKNFTNKDIPAINWEATDAEFSRALEITISEQE